LTELMPVVGRWKAIGEGLRLSPGILEQIDDHNPRDCMSAMLKHWLWRNYNLSPKDIAGSDIMKLKVS